MLQSDLLLFSLKYNALKIPSNYFKTNELTVENVLLIQNENVLRLNNYRHPIKNIIAGVKYL